MKHMSVKTGLKGLAISICLFCFLGYSSDAFGHCDPVILERADKNPVLAYREFNNRCEGFYSAQVSGSAITVMGFTLGGFDFKRDRTEVVEISLPYHADRNVHIQAKAIPVKTYYRMDADLDAGKKLCWPIQDIIYSATDLTSDQIGLCAWIKTNDRKINDRKIFIPVRAESGILGSQNDNRIRLTVRVLHDIGRFMWRMIPTAIDGENHRREYKDPEEGAGPVRMGEPITIFLPKEVAGPMDLELAARIKNTDEWIKEFVSLDLGGAKSWPAKMYFKGTKANTIKPMGLGKDR